MEAAQLRDRLEEIHAEFEVPVSRLCRRMIRDREAARDAAQQVWLEITRSLPSFDGRSRLSTWVWTVARRTVSRQASKEKTYSTRFLHEFFVLREDEGMPELERVPVEDRVAWARLQCDECLTGILHCLGNEDRFIYLLRVLGGLSFAEIAEIVECEEPAARQAYSRGSRKLSRFLSGNCALYNPDGDCRCKLKAPLRSLESSLDYRRVRELSKRMLFLEAAESFHPPKEYWRGFKEGLD